jgi:hypothetical protein
MAQQSPHRHPVAIVARALAFPPPLIRFAPDPCESAAAPVLTIDLSDVSVFDAFRDELPRFELPGEEARPAIAAIEAQAPSTSHVARPNPDRSVRHAPRRAWVSAMAAAAVLVTLSAFGASHWLTSSPVGQVSLTPR